jgi:putative aldouronate transport system substrate-binding protein
VLIAFRDRDPNGNGRRDEIPMIGVDGGGWSGITEWLINAFVYYKSSANAGVLNASNGRLSTPYTTEEYRNALRYIRGLVSDGLLSDLIFTNTADDLRALANPPNDVYTTGVMAGHPVLLWTQGGSTPDNYVIMPSLTGPAGVNYVAMGFPAVHGYSFITKDAQYPDVAFRLLDFFSREETGMVERWGEEGVDWWWMPAGQTIIEPYTGLPARFITPNTIWGATSQNKVWAVVPGIFMIDMYAITPDYAAAPNNATSWGDRRDAALLTRVPSALGKQPPERVDEIIFTQDEQDFIAEIPLTTFVNEQRALFLTGQRDIERDWNAYLNDLQGIGLQRYLEICQRAYTRTLSSL